MIDHLSASAVKKFNRCPKEYWLRYVVGYEMPEEEDSKYILLGNSIHEACEEVLREYPDLRDEERLLELLTEEDQELYPDSMAEDAEKCLETAAKYIANYVSDVQDIEERWTMDYNGIELVGYCDLVEHGRIVDWKTGKSEGKEMDEKIQAAFYIKLYEAQYGELPEQVDFAYLKEGTSSTHNRITDDGEVLWNNTKNEYWEDTEKVINRIINAANQDEFVAEPERDKCHWCDHKLYCRDSGMGAEDVESHHIELP